MAHARILTPPEYLRDIVEKINRAQVRVCILAMMIVDDETTSPLINALEQAARRGVRVKMAADVFTYAELSGFIMPTRYRTKIGRDTDDTIKRLRKAGVDFTWLGMQSMTLLNGRTHSKWSVIDDTVYAFGGINLYQEGLENTDYMFRVHDAELAAKLWHEYGAIMHANRQGYNYHSHFFASSVGTVLVDSGMFGNSLIYKRVCELAEQATSVILISQYCPTGKLSRILKKRNARLYFNPPARATPLNRILIATSMLLTGSTSLYVRTNYLHAKLMLFTMADGSEIAITGSHNFVRSASLLGTREIALQTSNRAIISQLKAFAESRVFSRGDEHALQDTLESTTQP